MRRRRWVLRGGVLTAVIAVCLLLGRGAGWIGTDPGAGDRAEDRSADVTPTPTPPPTQVGSGPAAAVPPAPAASATGPAPSAAAEPTAAAAPTVPAAPVERQPVDADRVAAVRALAMAEAEAGHFAPAVATMVELARLLPGGDAAPEVAELRQQIATLQAMAIDALCRDLADGRVLAARVRLDAMLATPDPAVVDAIDAAAITRSWPRLTPSTSPTAGPPASPLPADRLVRVLREGQERTGRVVSALPAEATLRIVEARGVTFPTLPVTTVEPVDVTPVEALQQARAAAAAGDGRLVRLWVASGLARAGASPPAELTALRAQLP